MQLNFTLHSFSYISLNHMHPATSNLVESSTKQSVASFNGRKSGPFLTCVLQFTRQKISNALFVMS